jgi:hypothetical protein
MSRRNREIKAKQRGKEEEDGGSQKTEIGEGANERGSRNQG